MRNQAWAKFVSERRKTKNLTRRRLAEATGLDTSYITLIERDGYVPRREKVLQLAEALGIDADHCLLVAGYAPDRIPVRELLARLQAFNDSNLILELKQLCQEMASLSEERQKQLVNLLRAALDILQGAPTAVGDSKKTGAKRRKALS